jgi:NTP pyrophosphatase (non-canonical NTP hydrolase)
MNLEPYRNFVLLKAAPPRQLTEQEYNILHACLGLSTELLELQVAETEENYREELEDIAWYLMLMAHSLNIPLGQLDETYKGEESEDLDKVVTESFENLISLGKKHCIYGKDKMSEMRVAFFPVWRGFLELIDEESYSLDSLIQNNMTKLNKRYAASFSQEESEARKDKE